MTDEAEKKVPVTLNEAIEQVEQAQLQMPQMKLRSISFSPPIMIVRNRSGSQVTRYDADDHGWDGWVVTTGGGSITFAEKGSGRSILVPMERCVVEHAPACPRCGTFLKRFGAPCHKEGCGWPKAERRVCPECKSVIPKERKTCPNPKCKWGWEDPDAKPAVELAKEAMKEAHPPRCAECDSVLVNGNCPLGHKKQKGGK